MYGYVIQIQNGFLLVRLVRACYTVGSLRKVTGSKTLIQIAVDRARSLVISYESHVKFNHELRSFNLKDIKTVIIL